MPEHKPTCHMVSLRHLAEGKQFADTCDGCQCGVAESPRNEVRECPDGNACIRDCGFPEHQGPVELPTTTTPEERKTIPQKCPACAYGMCPPDKGTEEWMEEFIDIIVKHGVGIGNARRDLSKFIRTLLVQARSENIKEKNKQAVKWYEKGYQEAASTARAQVIEEVEKYADNRKPFRDGPYIDHETFIRDKIIVGEMDDLLTYLSTLKEKGV